MSESQWLLEHPADDLQYKHIIQNDKVPLLGYFIPME